MSSPQSGDVGELSPLRPSELRLALQLAGQMGHYVRVGVSWPARPLLPCRAASSYNMDSDSEEIRTHEAVRKQGICRKTSKSGSLYYITLLLHIAPHGTCVVLSTLLYR